MWHVACPSDSKSEFRLYYAYAHQLDCIVGIREVVLLCLHAIQKTVYVNCVWVTQSASRTFKAAYPQQATINSRNITKQPIAKRLNMNKQNKQST